MVQLAVFRSLASMGCCLSSLTLVVASFISVAAAKVLYGGEAGEVIKFTGQTPTADRAAIIARLNAGVDTSTCLLYTSDAADDM
eukprot:1414064-Prymnesium_polylepis.1